MFIWATFSGRILKETHQAARDRLSAMVSTPADRPLWKRFVSLCWFRTFFGERGGLVSFLQYQMEVGAVDTKGLSKEKLWSLEQMSEVKMHTQVIKKGASPPCLKSGQRCRECLGWRKMFHAARSNYSWRQFPFRCSVTDLTLRLVS
jgi:hypothetical protein